MTLLIFDPPYFTQLAFLELQEKDRPIPTADGQYILTTEYNRMHLLLDLIFADFLFLDDIVDLDCLVTAAGCNELARRTERHTHNRSRMSFQPEHNLKLLIINRQPPIFRNRSKKLPTSREIHPIDRIAMMFDHLLDLPILGAPDDDCTGKLVLPFAARGEKFSFVVFCKGGNFVGVAVELVHLGPEGVFY